MAKSTALFVGLDVHKDSIAVAHAAGGRADPPVFVGEIGRAKPTSIDCFAACRGKARNCASSTRRARVGMACIAISPGRGGPVTWSRRR
jgi:hypothetical protein